MWGIFILSVVINTVILWYAAPRLPSKAVAAPAFGLALLSLLSPMMVYRGLAHDLTVTVNNDVQAKQRTDRWLVFTDHGVFEVTDTWSFLDFRASDRYAALKPGGTYRVTVAGLRFGWMSWYPNIVKVTPLS